MSNMRLPAGTRNALADALAARIDAGGGPGTISLYTAPQPANVDTAIDGQALLAVLTCSHPVADAAIAGVLTFNTISEDPSAAATGDVAWARIADSAGHPVFDCDVSGPNGGATLEINSAAIFAGGPVRLKNFTITFAAG